MRKEICKHNSIGSPLEDTTEIFFTIQWLKDLIDHHFEMNCSNSIQSTWVDVLSPGFAFYVDENIIDWLVEPHEDEG